MRAKTDHLLLSKIYMSDILQKTASFVYVLLTILLTVYGQIILKWRIEQNATSFDSFADRLKFLFTLFSDRWVLSAFVAAFLASISWIVALTRLNLSLAYPFMSLSFILVALLSGVFLKEPVSWKQIVGLFIIIIGIVISSQDADRIQ